MPTKSQEYLKIFCNIAKKIQFSNDREEILKLIVESAVKVMNGKACSLFLIRSRSEQDMLFYPAAQVGLSENYIHSGPAKGRDITNDILMQGGYLKVLDATSDPRVENHEVKKKEGIASMLVVPVIADKEPIGILALYTAKKRDFSEEDIAFLDGLADQGGIAILRAHSTYRRQKDLELLAAVSEHLNSSLDMNKVLSLAVSEITEAFDLKGVTIRLRDRETKELKLVASYGMSEKYLNKGPVSSDRITTVVKNKLELIDDIATYDIDYKEERQEEGIVSMLHLPISIKGTVIGIMGLYSDTKRVVGEDDIKLISSIARQCGLAIQNASLYLELKADKKELENEIWAHRAWF